VWSDWDDIDAAQAKADRGDEPEDAPEPAQGPRTPPRVLPPLSVAPARPRRRSVPTRRALDVLERMLTSGTAAERRIAAEIVEALRGRKG